MTGTSPSEPVSTPTGIRVREDLIDENYSSEEYERMLSMYEGTMASIAEGEIVKSRVLRIRERGDPRRRIQVGGVGPARRVQGSAPGGRRGRGLPRAPR